MRVGRMLGVVLATAVTVWMLMPAAALGKPRRLQMTWEAIGGPVHLLQAGETVNLLLSSFSVQTRSGVVECSTDIGAAPGIGGVDQTNDEATDKVELGFAEGVIGGEAGCVESSPPDFPPVRVLLDSHESILDLSGAKRRATIKAAAPAEPITLALEYTGGLLCLYRTNKLTGALQVAEPFPGNVSLAFKNQKLKLDRPGSGAGCSRSASLHADFGSLVTTEGVSSFEGGPVILGRLER